MSTTPPAQDQTQPTATAAPTPRPRGRPRRWASDAERCRARRASAPTATQTYRPENRPENAERPKTRTENAVTSRAVKPAAPAWWPRFAERWASGEPWSTVAADLGINWAHVNRAKQVHAVCRSGYDAAAVARQQALRARVEDAALRALPAATGEVVREVRTRRGPAGEVLERLEVQGADGSLLTAAARAALPELHGAAARVGVQVNVGAGIGSEIRQALASAPQPGAPAIDAEAWETEEDTPTGGRAPSITQPSTPATP